MVLGCTESVYVTIMTLGAQEKLAPSCSVRRHCHRDEILVVTIFSWNALFCFSPIPQIRYINFVKLTLSHIPSIPHCTLQAAFLHLNADTRCFRCIDIQYLCMQQNWIERFSVRLWSMKIHKSNQLSRRYQKNIDAGPMCKCEEILWKNNFLCHQIYCITSQVSTDLQAEQNTNLYWLLHYWYRVSDNIDIITINKEKVL